jgi:asparagine synthetase B (glutamine-hydrolysing)
MIGLFGAWSADRDEAVDVADLAARHPPTIDVSVRAATGGAVGLASHPGSRCRSAEDDGDVAVVVTGEFFEPALPGGPAPAAAERLLSMYRSGRLEDLSSVNGQFAAAIYDRSKHELVLVTDRLASVPLHYWGDTRGFTFASHVYVLLGDGRIPRRADPAALAQLFTLQRTLADRTPVAGIRAVPAATVMRVNRRGTSVRSYWQLRWRHPDFSERQGAELLADALRQAMSRQSDGPDVGLLLSGGLDSRLVLAASSRRPKCWTTASFEDNPELALARAVAGVLGAEHNTILVDPAATLGFQDATTRDGDGMFPASTSVAAFMPTVAAGSRIALTGHGLDYMLRGYYLPTRFMSIGGSKTRLPILASLPEGSDAASLFNHLRQGPPRRTIERIVLRHRADFWFSSQIETIANWLAPWFGSDQPLDAWDAFILSQVSKHYAFTSMAAVRSHVDLRIPAFDNAVLDLYLAMPPAWRVSAAMTQMAMKRLSPEAARLRNANTGFRADLDSRVEILALAGRGALRRLGILRRPETPTDSHSAGSWQNLSALFRRDPAHRQRFAGIRSRLDGLAFGLLDPGAVAACIDEHLEGTADHTKLLRQLLTHDSWVRVFGIT